MHKSADDLGRLFFELYWRSEFRRILDIGGLDVNGTLRRYCPMDAEYIGIDISSGPGVDLVLDDAYKYPFPDGHFDAIVSSSCFEHDTMFWLTFLEAMRVLSPNGFFYINAPSNGLYHAYPVDNWRFYPDAGVALEQWALRSQVPATLIESFIAGRGGGDIWNDCVMVFGKSDCGIPPRFICDAISVRYNVRRAGQSGISDRSELPEDLQTIMAQRSNIDELTRLLSESVNKTSPPPRLEAAVSLAPVKDTATLGAMLINGCAVCGGTEFSYQNVLWDALINEWQLAPDEVTSINIQQGFYCRACGSNLRSIVLARAICSGMGHDGTLGAWISSPAGQASAILEINGAGGLTWHLQIAPGHRLVSYPATDIHSLPFDDCSFDLVVHSDTLEHVPNPVHALYECRRVLRPDGLLAFTIPVVVGRMTRSREGLPPSYHGSPSDNRDDFLVRTEFGADAWALLPRVGFDAVTIHSNIFPAGLALTARK
jgi:SAM-dependent methyltransferase